MSQEIEVEVNKGMGKKVTDGTSFKPCKGDLMVYNEDLTEKGYDTPRITLSIAEDLEKFQFGIAKLTVEYEEDGTLRTFETLIHVDGIMSTIYAAYARNLNDLKRATIRQKTVRMYNKISDIFWYLKNLYIETRAKVRGE